MDGKTLTDVVQTTNDNTGVDESTPGPVVSDEKIKLISPDEIKEKVDVKSGKKKSVSSRRRRKSTAKKTVEPKPELLFEPTDFVETIQMTTLGVAVLLRDTRWLCPDEVALKMSKAYAALGNKMFKVTGKNAETKAILATTQYVFGAATGLFSKNAELDIDSAKTRTFSFGGYGEKIANYFKVKRNKNSEKSEPKPAS